MSGLAGRGNVNLRLVHSAEPSTAQPAQITVELADENADIPEYDNSGNVVRIKNGDGSITVSLDGKPIQAANESAKPIGWFGNLAEQIDDSELGDIANDLLTGIAEDIESRREWIEERALGVKLLALKVELPNTQGATEGAPVEGMSKVRHPLLLESVLRFQANARSELLPTDGPVKIRNDSTSPTMQLDQDATALEMDMNHYLTVGAPEYYPDTDRMLFMTGFGGGGFKKLYKCPLRMRPLSESVDAEDLIVNQSATDLQSAQRVTHRVRMKPSTVKRMQIIGAYLDIELGDAVARSPDPLDLEKASQQGITIDTARRPQDRERELYECCCELNLKKFEHKDKGGRSTGLAVPYVVTIDVSTRQVLSVVRNFNEDTKEMPVARERFVMYPFVPGMGFYPIGLLHILGNTTNAVTAAWRELLDCGMFASFPGFLTADTAGRQNTNIFRIPPGGSAQIKTGGMPIKDFAMALPYSTSGMAATMGLVENMVETGRRIGGTAEVQVGEGRADVPVGTVMAMIDQAIKVMNAVHKRIHSAQAKEFQLLKQLILEDIENFLRFMCKSKTPWDKQRLVRALTNANLVPQADPNTSSNGQRIMKVVGLKQLQKDNAQLYDPIKVDTAALSVMGWANPEEFFVPPAARAQPPAQLLEKQAEMANEAKKADAATADARAKLITAEAGRQETTEKIVQGHYAPEPEHSETTVPPPSEIEYMDMHTKLMDAQTRRREVAVHEHTTAVEDHNRDQDRQTQEREAVINLAKEVIMDPSDAAGAGQKANKIVDEIDKGLGSHG